VIAAIAEIGREGKANVGIEMHEQLRQRTKQFALRIIRLSRHLPSGREADVIGKQVLRSGTAVAANYRAAGRSRSRADFISKISVLVEEADETVFWLELLEEANLMPTTRLEPLLNEARETRCNFYRFAPNSQGMKPSQKLAAVGRIPAIPRDFGGNYYRLAPVSKDMRRLRALDLIPAIPHDFGGNYYRLVPVSKDMRRLRASDLIPAIPAIPRDFGD